jgi:hypothetical protein
MYQPFNLPATMSIRIKNPNSLKPRLLGRNSADATRVEGVLLRDGGTERVLVDEIAFDGTTCRYRSLRGTQDWHTEQDGDEYHCCAQSIMDQLRRLGCDNPSEQSVIDSVITENGAMLVAVSDEGSRYCRWLPLSA